jgi:hypothetical protein
MLACLLLSGCSNTSILIPDHERNTAEYNLLDSPDGMTDPNLRTKLFKVNY